MGSGQKSPHRHSHWAHPQTTGPGLVHTDDEGGDEDEDDDDDDDGGG